MFKPRVAVVWVLCLGLVMVSSVGATVIYSNDFSGWANGTTLVQSTAGVGRFRGTAYDLTYTYNADFQNGQGRFRTLANAGDAAYAVTVKQDANASPRSFGSDFSNLPSNLVLRFESQISTIVPNSQYAYASMILQGGYATPGGTGGGGSTYKSYGQKLAMWIDTGNYLTYRIINNGTNTTLNTGTDFTSSVQPAGLDIISGTDQVNVAIELDKANARVRMGYQVIDNAVPGAWSYTAWTDPTSENFGSQAFGSNWVSDFGSTSYLYLQSNSGANASGGVSAIYFDNLKVETVVPEPATLVLLSLGGLSLLRRKHSR